MLFLQDGGRTHGVLPFLWGNFPASRAGALGAAAVALREGRKKERKEVQRCHSPPDMQHPAACGGRLLPLCLVPARGV